MAAGDHDLGTLRGLADLDDVSLQAGTVVVALVRHLLGLRQQGFHFAKVKQGEPAVGLLDDSRHDVAFAPGVLFVLPVALRLAHSLHEHLLGGLGGDPAEVGRSVIPLPHDIALVV